jgi:hypothetical protein
MSSTCTFHHSQEVPVFLPITLPKGVPLDDFRRLQAHAAWYLREAARHGPGFGAKRFARARLRRQRRTSSTVPSPVAAPSLMPL